MELGAILQACGIAADRYEHAPVMTVEESLRLLPAMPGAKTKNLFLRDKKGTRHFLVTAAHDRGVDIAALGALLGAGRLGFASPERLQRHLGVLPGAVSLLALCNDESGAVELVLDRALWEAPSLQAHPLVNSATLILSHADLERFLGATGHTPRLVDLSSMAAGGTGATKIEGASE